MAITISDSDLLVIQVENNQPIGHPMTYSNFRLIHPQTSFPALPANSFLVDFGFKVFKYTEKPVPVQFERTTEGPIAWDEVKDAYTNTWVNTPFTEQEIETARQNRLQGIRNVRNFKLQECDWTQLPDVQLTTEQVQAWQTYRQQLRDYMELVLDPFNPPVFPSKP